MRPPTRSTRSVRQRRPSKKVSSNSTRGSPPTPAPFLLEVNPQPTESITDSNTELGTAVSTTGIGSLPSESWAPATFVYENQTLASTHAGVPDATVTPAGKQPRSRHRMTSDKLETLEASFRNNTHPSRKEKETICKDLDMDLKTVTIWFQNKRQTVARSRKQSESYNFSSGTLVPATAMNMLAAASATMTPLAAKTGTRLGSGSGGSCAGCSSLDNSDLPASRLLHASSCAACPSAPDPDLRPRIPLSGAVTAQNSDVFESAPLPRELRTSRGTVETRVFSSPSSPEDLEPRKPLNHHWPIIQPENLWKYIPSSPVRQEQPVPPSSPDVSPCINVGGGSADPSLRRRPRTLEWACARSAKRRRTNPDTHSEDGEADSGCNAERAIICYSPCCAPDARVPPECHGKYPLDVVRGAVLLLGLKNATHGLGV